MTQESGYRSLLEMDTEEFQVRDQIQEKKAPTHSLNILISEINQQYGIFKKQVDEKENENEKEQQQQQYGVLEDVQRQFLQIRYQLFQLVHYLRQQMMNKIELLENGQNINGFPLNFEKYDQIYSLISTLIKRNLTSTEKLINTTFERESLNCLSLVIKLLRIKAKTSWNHFYVIMNTFALEIQNTSLPSKFFTSLFYSKFYFNIQSMRVDQEINKLKFNTFIMMHKEQFESNEDDFANILYQDRLFSMSFGYLQSFEQLYSDDIGVINKIIVPHLQDHWQEIKSDIGDLLLKVGQSTRFKQGLKSFKSFFQIQGHVDVKPFRLTNIHFLFVCDPDIEGFTLMNGDIVVNLRILVEIYKNNDKIDISQIFRALVLYLLTHEYGHILLRRSLNNWSFQTTELGQKSAIESIYNMESGVIFEIILFGKKLYQKQTNQKSSDREKSLGQIFNKSKFNSSQEIDVSKIQDQQFNQSEQNSSQEIENPKIQSQESKKSIQCLSNLVNSNKPQILGTDQKIISNEAFLKEIIDPNYWSISIRRKYPISDYVITTITFLNQYYLLDSIKFQELFKKYSTPDPDDADVFFLSLEGFKELIWSINDQIDEYIIKDTFHYIDWESKQFISFYLMTLAFQLDCQNIQQVK
ncbi:hypothetical protein pb186bvf_002613 [Paramecium bursaria]